MTIDPKEIKKAIETINKFVENDAYVRHEKEIVKALNIIISCSEELLQATVEVK